AELVKVVVCGDVLEAGEVLVGAVALIACVSQRRALARCRGGNAADGTQCERGLEELAPIEINVLRRDLGGGDARAVSGSRTLDQHGTPRNSYTHVSWCMRLMIDPVSSEFITAARCSLLVSGARHVLLATDRTRLPRWRSRCSHCERHCERDAR